MTKKLDYPTVGDLFYRNPKSSVDDEHQKLLGQNPKYKLILKIEKKTDITGNELFRLEAINLGQMNNNQSNDASNKPVLVTPFMTLESFHNYFLVTKPSERFCETS